jgi:hypothetical protein
MAAAQVVVHAGCNEGFGPDHQGRAATLLMTVYKPGLRAVREQFGHQQAIRAAASERSRCEMLANEQRFAA